MVREALGGRMHESDPDRAMSAPRAVARQFERDSQRKLSRRRRYDVVAVSWTRNNRRSSFPVRPRRHAMLISARNARGDEPLQERGLRRKANSMRSSVLRGNDSATGMPRAWSFCESRSKGAKAFRGVSFGHANVLVLSSRFFPKSRRIGAALTLRLSTQAMRCGSTEPWTDDAMTVRSWPGAASFDVMGCARCHQWQSGHRCRPCGPAAPLRWPRGRRHQRAARLSPGLVLRRWTMPDMAACHAPC